MKNFNILGVHWKIQLLGGISGSPIVRGEASPPSNEAPPSEKQPPPPPPPLKREVPLHEMITRKSTINNNLRSS